MISYIKKIDKGALDCFMLYTIAATIPFTVSLGNIAIISAFIYVVLTSRIVFLKQLRKYPSVLSLPLIYLFLILISTMLSDNLVSGFKLVDKSIFFLLIPVILIALSEQIKQKKVLLIFAKSTFAATIILIMYSTVRAINTGNIDNLFFHRFTSLFDQHPVYFSTYQALAVLILSRYQKKTGSKKKLSHNLMISILIFGILLSASKMVIFIFSLIIGYLAIKSFKKKDKKIILAPIFLVFLLVALPKTRKRFVEGINYDLVFKPTNDIAKSTVFNYADKHMISDLEIRYIFGSIGIYHFLDDNKILFGYGVGDVQDYLDLYYMQYGLAPNWYEGYNLHNQYLQVLISSGIFVFLFFLYYIYFHMKKSFRKPNMLSSFFLVIILSVFLVESVLMRNKGIIVFVFFTSLFLIQNLKYENSHSGHKGHT